jgi:L-aspartate oxidase
MTGIDGPLGQLDVLDVLVVGSGVAGLTAAVRLAARGGLRVGVLTKGELEQSTTRFAQGGVAAVLAGDEDSTDLHLADTLRAGAGLCDVPAVRVLVDEGPRSVHELISLGAVFDRAPGGGLALAREGGHSTARVVHAGGTATGAEVERTLVGAVRESAAAILQGWFALDLIIETGRCRGVAALDPAGLRREVRASHVLLASGGCGQLYEVTTNPTEATGDGVAMALRAGVAVADIEFVQFHPTALHHPAMPRPLISEALRGHGALLRDRDGERFVDELAPRDVVSRAMAVRMAEAGVEHLWLDATGLEDFDARFPTIAASLAAAGLDPATDLLPVAPAAHHLCGGILTDLSGATALPGLWAAGEVACSGVHGANRLASNSLLEGMVFAARTVDAIIDGVDGPSPSGVLAAAGAEPPAGSIELRPLERPELSRRRPLAGDRPERAAHPGARAPAGDAADDLAGVTEGQGLLAADLVKARERLQRAMTAGAGVFRDAGSLRLARREVEAIAGAVGAEDRRQVAELSNLLTLARGLLAAALAREESRGAHSREDFPATSDAYRCRLVLGDLEQARRALAAR